MWIFLDKKKYYAIPQSVDWPTIFPTSCPLYEHRDIKVLSTISGLQSFGLKIMACIRHKLRTYFILTEFFSHQDFHYDLVTTTTRVLK